MEIVPSFTLPRQEMICGTVGPLRPQVSPLEVKACSITVLSAAPAQIPSSVPLWMAIDLRVLI